MEKQHYFIKALLLAALLIAMVNATATIAQKPETASTADQKQFKETFVTEKKQNFDQLVFRLPKLSNQKWRLAYQKSNASAGIAEYIPSTQNLENWQQMVTIEYLAHKGIRQSATAEQFMKMRLSMLKKMCANLKYKLLHQNKKQLFYSWQITGCGTGLKADQFEMVRIIKGQHGYNWIRYTIKTNEPTPQNYEDMLHAIMSARFLKA